MRSFIVALAVAGLAGTTGLARAQNASGRNDSLSAVRPGDRAIDGARLAPHTGAWRVSYETPAGQPVSGGPRRVSIWYDTVTFDTMAGRRALHRRQVLRSPNDSVLETIDNWVDPRTLAPIRTDNRYPGGKLARRDYRATRVTGFDPDSTFADGRKPVAVTLAEPVFDFFGGMYDLFLAAMPLREGYRVQIPTDDGAAPPGSALQWTTLTVIGSDSIPTNGPTGAVRAWHVTTNRTAIGSFEFWITADSRMMIRMWYIGPRGGKQVWS